MAHGKHREVFTCAISRETGNSSILDKDALKRDIAELETAISPEQCQKDLQTHALAAGNSSLKGHWKGYCGTIIREV